MPSEPFAALAAHPETDAIDAEWLRGFDPERDLREPVDLARLPITALSSDRRSPITHAFSENGRPHFLGVTIEDDAKGYATVADADVIAMLISIEMKLKNEGRPIPRRVLLPLNTLLRLLGRPVGGAQRALLIAALWRLANTSVQISGRSSGLVVYNLLEQVVPPPGGRGPWLFALSAFLRDDIAAGRVLKIAPEALRLHGVARRLYSLCNAHTGGHVEPWRPDLCTLARLCAWQGPFRKFRAKMSALIATQAIPGFALALEPDGTRARLAVTRLKPSAPRFSPRTAKPEALTLSLPELAYDNAPSFEFAEPIHLALDDEFDG